LDPPSAAANFLGEGLDGPLIHMDDCCEVREVPGEQRRGLLVVFLINAALFLTERVGGGPGGPTTRLRHPLGMLRRALVYGFSLYVIGRGVLWQARAALLKGLVMAAFGVGVLVQVAVKIAQGLTPTVEVMSMVGALALAANLVCLTLLWRRREDDINMRS